MLYLVNPNIFAETTEHPLKLSTKAEAVKLGEKIMKRIFENIETGNDSELHNDSDTGSGSGTQDLATSSPNMYDRLQTCIGSVHGKSNVVDVDEEINYKKEFQLYERFKKRSPLLESLHQALNTAQGTSTQSERDFSMAGWMVTKRRSKLKSETVDALCYLNRFFRKNH